MRKPVAFRSVIKTALTIAFCLTVIEGHSAQAQTFQVIHNFTGGLDGANPEAGLTMDATGNFYGTTTSGGRGTCTVSGVNGCGTVFKLTRLGTFQPLYQFTGDLEGAIPTDRAIVGPDGALYGTTIAGGQGNCVDNGVSGCGTIYKLMPPATFCRSVFCPWSETTLHRFTGGSDGQFPLGDLTFDHIGNLYGTTELGGMPGCAGGCGVVFELTHGHGNWNEIILYSFEGTSDGGEPTGGVTFDASGRLDGTTFVGGNLGDCQGSGCGTVFQLTRSGSNWTENTLYSFQGGNDGFFPAITVMLDPAGNLYSATLAGGSGGGGTVLELSPSGGSWLFSLLYSFTGNQGPTGDGLIVDSAGNLYGTTFADGTNLKGSVFMLRRSGDHWIYTSLHDFTGGADGANPVGGVVLGTDGNLYGTTYNGGASRLGVIFKIAPSP